MSTAPAPATVIAALVDSIIEMQAYHDVPGTRDDPQWCAILRRGGDALVAAMLLEAAPAPGLEEAVEMVAATIRHLKQRIDYRLNDHLCEMKPDYDDSMTGFNEAWDVVREAFKEAIDNLAANAALTTKGDGREKPSARLLAASKEALRALDTFSVDDLMEGKDSLIRAELVAAIRDMEEGNGR